jgi:hypothetical protein
VGQRADRGLGAGDQAGAVGVGLAGGFQNDLRRFARCLVVLEPLEVDHEGVWRAVGQVGQQGVARLDLLDGYLFDGVVVGVCE